MAAPPAAAGLLRVASSASSSSSTSGGHVSTVTSLVRKAAMTDFSSTSMSDMGDSSMSLVAAPAWLPPPAP
eukprot:6546941-Pyramimonas_sp.AAC.1